MNVILGPHHRVASATKQPSIIRSEEYVTIRSSILILKYHDIYLMEQTSRRFKIWAQDTPCITYLSKQNQLQSCKFTRTKFLLDNNIYEAIACILHMHTYTKEGTRRHTHKLHQYSYQTRHQEAPHYHHN